MNPYPTRLNYSHLRNNPCAFSLQFFFFFFFLRLIYPSALAFFAAYRINPCNSGQSPQLNSQLGLAWKIKRLFVVIKIKINKCCSYRVHLLTTFPSQRNRTYHAIIRNLHNRQLCPLSLYLSFSSLAVFSSARIRLQRKRHAPCWDTITTYLFLLPGRKTGPQTPATQPLTPSLNPRSH